MRGNKKRRLARMLGKLTLRLLKAKPTSDEMNDLAPQLTATPSAKRSVA